MRAPCQSQRLLVPAVVEIKGDASCAGCIIGTIIQSASVSKQISWGLKTVAIHAFPTLLFERRVDPVAFMTELLDRSGEDDAAQSSEAALHEVVDMIACKAAIKAGDVAQ